jgi:hypothetical protein
MEFLAQVYDDAEKGAVLLGLLMELDKYSERHTIGGYIAGAGYGRRLWMSRTTTGDIAGLYSAWIRMECILC